MQGDVRLIEEENVRKTRLTRQEKQKKRINVQRTDGEKIIEIVKTQMKKNSTEFLSRPLTIDRQAKAFRVKFDVIEKQKHRDEHEHQRTDELKNEGQNLKGEQIERPVETQKGFVGRR